MKSSNKWAGSMRAIARTAIVLVLAVIVVGMSVTPVLARDGRGYHGRAYHGRGHWHQLSFSHIYPLDWDPVRSAGFEVAHHHRETIPWNIGLRSEGSVCCSRSVLRTQIRSGCAKTGCGSICPMTRSDDTNRLPGARRREEKQS
jgi:hypothetical protein